MSNPKVNSIVLDGTTYDIEDASVDRKINEIKGDLTKIKKLKDYLYSCDYTTYDYEKAYDYFSEPHDFVMGCSSVRVGKYYGRNLDIVYDNTSEFVVRTPATSEFHKVIGLAAIPGALTDSIVDSGAENELYDILPFYLMDGINDAGLVMNINLAPAEDATVRTTGTKQGAKASVNCLMLTRYILDRCGSVDEAIAEITDINIFTNNSQEYHFMIADKSRTVVIEFHNNQVIICDGTEVMTNFYLHNFDGNTATASYKSTQYDPSTTTLTLHAAGVERYDLLDSNKTFVNSAATMMGLIGIVKYTSIYNGTERIYIDSDFNTGSLTINSVDNDYVSIESAARAIHSRKDRTPGTSYYGSWHSIHSVVYDVDSKSLYLCTQEDYADVRTFSLYNQNDFESFVDTYSRIPVACGRWLDGSVIYRRVYEVTEGIAKDNVFRVANKPYDYLQAVKSCGISFGTQEVKKSISNSEITTFVDSEGIWAINKLTGYCEKMEVILEYTRRT